jgi:outer membrane lipoprotein-sorting protein
MLTTNRNRQSTLRLVGVFLIALSSAIVSIAQQGDNAAVIQHIDASVNARDQGLAGYTVTEHYAVFRNQDQVHPTAEMMVKTTYQKDVGKSYAILSESGPSLLRKQVLETILDNEKRMTQPANRALAVITSSNYGMAVKGAEALDGRNCVVVALTPKRESPYLFTGTIWVDAQDYSIVQFQGIASKAPSMLTGPAQVTRQYETIEGFPMATHAKAVSNSWLLGQTTIKIDYIGYEIKLRSNATGQANSAPVVAPAPSR